MVETIINFEEIKAYYKERCEEISLKFSEEGFEEFVALCERDFFTWLNENWNTYCSENSDDCDDCSDDDCPLCGEAGQGWTSSCAYCHQPDPRIDDVEND